MFETTPSTGGCHALTQLSNITAVNNTGRAICAYRGIAESQGFTTLRSSLLMGNGTTCTRVPYDPNDERSNPGTFTSAGGNVIDTAGDCTFGETDTTLPEGTLVSSVVDTTLADNGGPTQTLSLPIASPAIDGALDACVDHADAAVAIDQRGIARDATCDAGAFEVQVP
jgi:hypothetical protein